MKSHAGQYLLNIVSKLQIQLYIINNNNNNNFFVTKSIYQFIRIPRKLNFWEISFIRKASNFIIFLFRHKKKGEEKITNIIIAIILMLMLMCMLSLLMLNYHIESNSKYRKKREREREKWIKNKKYKRKERKGEREKINTSNFPLSTLLVSAPGNELARAFHVLRNDLIATYICMYIVDRYLHICMSFKGRRMKERRDATDPIN